MKTAFICPTLMLNLIPLGNYHLVLSHLIEHEEIYRRFYKDLAARGHYIILDNSADELEKPVSRRQLIRQAQEINASEVVAPDILNDRGATCAEARKFLAGVPSKRAFKVMIVPQGKTVDDWLACYKTLLSYKFETFGIPKRVADLFGTRAACLQKLVDLGWVHRERFEYHLLGIQNNPIEIKKEAVFDWIRGVDTASPLHHGLLGVLFNPLTGLPEGKYKKDDKKFFSSVLESPAQKDIILLNIERFKRWAKNENSLCE